MTHHDGKWVDLIVDQVDPIQFYIYGHSEDLVFKLRPWETKFKLDVSIQPAKRRKISEKDV